MARCRFCRQEMRTAQSCMPRSRKFPRIIIGGEIYEPIRFGKEHRLTFDLDRCPDCGVGKGGAHHPGCDIEECPACGGQLISCHCCEPTRNVVWTV